MTNSLLLWILFTADFVLIISSEDCPVGAESCKNERIPEIHPEINWPLQCQPSNELVVSYQHRCLDIYKHYVTRRCSEIGWVPEVSEVNCPYSIDEYTIRTPCPPDYKILTGDLDYIKICVRIFPPQRWENLCVSSGSSFQFDDYNLEVDKGISLKISNLLMDEFEKHECWSPARRIFNKDFNEFANFPSGVDMNFQWTLAGILGKKAKVAGDMNYDCVRNPLTFGEGTTHLLYPCDCNETLPILCLYDHQQPTMLQLSCPDGYKSSRYAHYQHVCIKIYKFAEPRVDMLSDDYVQKHICENIFHVDSGFALHIFQELSISEQLIESDRCLFGIVPNKVIITEEEWTKLNMSQVTFINWSFDVSISPEDSNEFKRNILVAKSNGEWIWDNLVTCAICSIPNEVHRPNFELRKNMDGNLVVAVQNEKYLWRDLNFPNGLSCFSFTFKSVSPADVSLTPMESNSTQKHYKLETSGLGLGKYWCVGLEIQSFQVIEAEFMWNFPLKFAIVARNFTTIEQPDQQFDLFLKNVLNATHFQVKETSLQSSLSSSTYLFHAVIIPITDYFLTFEKNFIKLNERMLVAYYIHQYLNETRLLQKMQAPFQILTFNSTEFCLPVSISQLEKFYFSGTRIGRYVTSNELCLLNGSELPVTKRCVGDGLYGGVWKSGIVACNNSIQSSSTMKLHNLTNLQMSSEEMSHIVYQLEEIIFNSSYSSLIAADIFYVSQIMHGIQHSTHSLHYDDVRRILRIYNRLLKVNGNVMHTASVLNATNVLLEAVDVNVSNFGTDTRNVDNLSRNGILSFEFDEQMLSTFIFNPELTNVTGVFATQRLSEVTVSFLRKNEKIEDIINIPDLKVASFLPIQLLQHINTTLIIVSLFMSNVLFQPYYSTGSSNPNLLINSSGSIISIVLPGTNGTSDLPEKLPIFIKPDQRNDDDSDGNVCGFWSFSPIEIGWATSGCLLNRKSLNPNIVFCECTHLTHFTYLFYGNSLSDTRVDTKHFNKLQLLTTGACSTSLVGLFGIYLSAALFKSWRTKSSTKFLLQISLALTIELIIILFVNTEAITSVLITTGNSAACIALGAILHYTVLGTFLWMLIIGYMQYMRYVVVFHQIDSQKFLLISMLIGWGLPTVPVVIVLLADAQNYIPTTGNCTICYPSGYSLYFGLMTPIAFITTTNLTIFVLIIKSLTKNLAGGQETRAIILSKIRLWTFLFFLLGLTWIFVFLSATNAGMIFTYLFCATATLQGFVLFCYFVILDPYVRGLWIALCCKKTK